MKTLTSWFRIAISAAVIGAAAVSPAAHAVLGGAPGSSVHTDPAGAIVRAATQAPYSVSESILTGGTIVHEYVARDGIVFAVTWSGPQIPDLRALLGTRFDSYVSALAQQRAAGGMHGATRIAGGDAVVRSTGHMGAFAGLAYLPALLPPGVNPSDLH